MAARQRVLCVKRTDCVWLQLQVSEDREEARRRNTLLCKDHVSVTGATDDLTGFSSCSASNGCVFQGVLSDSENEEPISWRVRNISAFIRRPKNCAAFSR